MTRDIIDIHDFTVLVETSDAQEPSVDSCTFDEPVIAVAFYGSGNVDLEIRYGSGQKSFTHTKGMALSFYADKEVAFVHKVSAKNPLQCLVIATAISKLQKLPNQEGDLFEQALRELVTPSDHFVQGPLFYMSPEMQQAADQFFQTRYTGKTRMMFFRSQVTALLSHYFGQLSLAKEQNITDKEREKLQQAREILLENLENPPSLNELSRQIGLNSFKLKKNFKELFGVPVFKYLQNQRLNTAHQLLRDGDLSIQEAAWQVGYDSLSSFSNAFAKKFGFRPSAIKR